MTTKFCPACSTQVTQKLWTANVNGRKNKQKVAELKTAVPAQKRQVPDTSSDVTSAAKRLKRKHIHFHIYI